MSKKSSILIDILQVEDKLRTLSQDNSYRKMKRIIQQFSQMRGSLITVPSPENYDRQVTLRKNTDEFNNAFEQYEDRISVYDERFKKLSEERRSLEKQLFG
jgi:uncharacterized coiled-coil DUF342 family protein